MTSLIGARRRAEEFDAALRSPATDTAAELQPLLSVVAALRSHEAPAPRADFAASLREQLMAEAAEVLAPSTPLALPPRRRGARERRLTIAASAFVLIGGTAGMAAAAQSSAPGDALYPLKRGLENVDRTLQRDDAAKGHAFLSQADARLDEAAVLAGRDATTQEISTSLRSFSTQATAGSDLLLGSFQEKQDPALVRDVRSFTADSLDALAALGAVAPAHRSDEIAQVGFVLQGNDAAAAQACRSCYDHPALQVPEDMQLTAEVQRATKQVQIRKPDNSHPAPAVRLPLSEPSTGTSTDGSGGATGGDQTTAGGGLPTSPLDSQKEDVGTALPKDPQDLLGAVDDATGGLVGSVGDKVGETADKLLPQTDPSTSPDDLLK
jgi:hypothetical protein